VHEGHTRKEGISRQHNRAKIGKAIKCMKLDISVVYKEKSERDDKTAIRNHLLTGLQKITVGRSIWRNYSVIP